MRNLSGSGHVAIAHFVEDLARLRLTPRIDFGRLQGGQNAKRGIDPIGIGVHRLQGDNQAVAAERRDEPRDAGGRDRPVGEARLEHGQIGVALRDESVELRRGRFDDDMRQEVVALLPFIGERDRPSSRLRLESQLDRRDLVASEVDVPRQGRRALAAARGLRLDRRRHRAGDVQEDIAPIGGHRSQDDAIVSRPGDLGDGPLVRRHAANVEHVAKVGTHLQRQHAGGADGAEVAHGQTHHEGRVQTDLLACQHRLRFDAELQMVQVRVGERDDGHVRTGRGHVQLLKLMSQESELVPAQEASIAGVQPGLVHALVGVTPPHQAELVALQQKIEIEHG